jgi:hypothetical protein
MRKILIVLLLFFVVGCSHFKPSHVAFNVGYGEDTILGVDLSKVREGDSYNISDFSVEFIKENKEWLYSIEFSIVDHKYVYVDNSKHYNDHATSYTTKVWLIRNYKFEHIDIFTGAGMGCGYMNPGNNRYVYNSKFISDLGLRIGLQKSFEHFGIRVEYMLRHFSAIWKDDKGENEDEIRAGIVIPLGK